MVKELYFRFRNLILYGIIGGFCAALDFGVYTALCYFDIMPYLWANIISIHMGIFMSFILNRSFNFKVKDKTTQRFLSFYAVGLTGLGISELMLYLMVTSPSNEILMDKIYFVLPAYNEEANIEEVIAQWHPICEQINAEGNEALLVIANDGSKDKTFAIMQKLQAKYSLLKPLDKQNSGHGSTVLYLYHYAINNKADYIFQTDSDGQTLPEEFWQMWKNHHNFDFQIGTRGGRQDGASRVFVTKTLRLVVWLMFHVWVKDANTPFRLLKVEKLKPILDVIPQDYNLANVAVSAIAVRWHYSIGWYPITFRPRQGGVNSINMKRIFKIGVKALTDFRTINRNLQ